jgi:C4-dicarboxylate transporter DctM subunit
LLDPVQMAYIGMGLMLLLIVLHVPIGISMIVVGIVGFGAISGFSPALTLLATESASVIGNVDLAVVPLFLLMGNFAASAGLSEDVYNLAHAFLGHRRGGLCLSTIGGCAFFGAVCGSSPATAATFGRVALPEMLKRKYEPSFATGTIAAGGTLGSLVPPSVIMIIYAIMAEEFIIALFLAAVIPAIMEVVFYWITIMIWMKVRPLAGPAGNRINWNERLRTIGKSWGAIVIAITVLGGIYGGIFTVTEAASFGVFLSFIFAFSRRRLSRKMFWESLISTANTTGMIYVIMIGANVITYFIGVSRLSIHLVEFISNMNIPNLATILVLMLIYLVLGSLFDTVAAMLITLPFVLPLITNMGYDPVWWGIVNVVVIETGMITPPIGLNVFVLKGVTGFPINIIYRGTLPFVLADSARLLLLIIFPALALWLPTILK